MLVYLVKDLIVLSFLDNKEREIELATLGWTTLSELESRTECICVFFLKATFHLILFD